MNPATILSDARVLQLEYFRPSSDSVVLVVKTVQMRGHCPRCGRSSTKVYSRYTRCVADLPWHGVPVRLELHTRRFRCPNSLCTQRIFCGRFPSLRKSSG